MPYPLRTMNYHAASSVVFQKALNAPRDGEYNPKRFKNPSVQYKYHTRYEM